MFSSLWLQAFNVGVQAVLMLICSGFMYLAWRQDKREKQRINQLKLNKIERDLRRQQGYY